MNDKLLYRIPEVAEHLSISRSKVYELLKSGELRSVHISIERDWSVCATFRPMLTRWQPLNDCRHHRASDVGRCHNEDGRRPILSKVRTFRLFLDLVAQKGHAIFEPGGLDQLQVLPILEDACSLAA